MRAHSVGLAAAIVLLRIAAFTSQAVAGGSIHHNTYGGQNGQNGQNGLNGANGQNGRDGRNGRSAFPLSACAQSARANANPSLPMKRPPGASSIAAQRSGRWD